MNNGTSIFKDEQTNIIKRFEKAKEIKKLILWELLGLLIIVGVSYIFPAINEEENIKQFVILFISSIVLIVADLIVIIKCLGKEKKVNILYFAMCLLMGVILKLCYKNDSIKNILICSAIIIMYYTIVAIISLCIDKLFLFLVPLVIAVLYLCWKYLIFNAYIIIIVLNTVSFSLIFVEYIKKITSEPKKEDIVIAKILFLIIFIVENIFLSNVI